MTLGLGRPRRYGLSLALAATVLVAGCGFADRHPILAADGLHAAHDQFVVEYASAERRYVAGNRWDLDNFLGSLSATKSAPEYRAQLSIDSDGDGRAEVRTSEDLYDARLVDRVSGSTMWIRSVPIASSLRDRDLAVMADSYAAAVSGGSYYAVDFGAVARDRRFATRVLRTAACEWDGIEAHAIEFTVSDVDRAQLGDTSPELQVTVVLAHAPSSWLTPGHALPSILVAGLAVSPDDVANADPAFAALLGRVRIRGAGHEPRPAGTTSCPFP